MAIRFLDEGRERARKRARSDMDLLWWLVQLGREDREHYRLIRAAMWALFVENSTARSERSDKPSNSC
jgi:hypothetical protein